MSNILTLFAASDNRARHHQARIPVSALPNFSREVRLTVRPEGLPGTDNFEIVAAPLPVPKEDEALIRNLYFVVSASLRMMISKGAEDVAGVPFPHLHEGDALAGEALGEVVSAPAGSGLSPGDLVLHFSGWREYAAVPATQCIKLPDGLPDPILHLGHGWTAYAAFTRARNSVRSVLYLVAKGPASSTPLGRLSLP